MPESRLEAVKCGARYVCVKVLTTLYTCLVCKILAIVRRHAAYYTKLAVLVKNDITTP